MCYDDEARPPVPPGGGHAHGEEIVLTASDGNRFAVYFALPQQPTGVGILICRCVRGLHQFYKELALRFAEVGVTALAIDYFGRTAGISSRDESFEYMPHIQQISLDTFFLDVQAGLDYLRGKTTPKLPIFLVGFCSGGSITGISGAHS